MASGESTGCSARQSMEQIPDVARAKYEKEMRLREKAVEALKDKVYENDEDSLRTKCVPTVTPMGVLWALLSLMVAGTCSFSFLQPFWFTHPDNMDSLGIFSYCIRDPTANAAPLRQVCGIYGGEFHFSNLPSHAWQATCVLYGGGCSFLCITAFLSIVTLIMPRYCDKKLAIFCGYLQTMAVLIMTAGLLVYPLGLKSKFALRYCQGGGAYHAGTCQIGWAYMLGIMGTALAMFCPFLSQYTDMKVNESSEYV